MQAKKFEFTGETKVNELGVTLNRIRCIERIKTSSITVEPGDLGGWIQKMDNLDENGWVSDDAQIFGGAQVSGDAQVCGNALVFGNAQVSDDAQV